MTNLKNHLKFVHHFRNPQLDSEVVARLLTAFTFSDTLVFTSCCLLSRFWATPSPTHVLPFEARPNDAVEEDNEDDPMASSQLTL